MNTNSFPKDLYEYIDIIKTNPKLYLGSKTISSLSAHILGYTIACYYKGVEETLVPDFTYFNDFVVDHYKTGTAEEGWKSILLRSNQNNNKKAFDEFFKLFDSFRKSLHSS